MTTGASDMVAAIEGMYAAIGENDRLRLNGLLCEDFDAFENGVAMSSRELLGLLTTAQPLRARDLAEQGLLSVRRQSLPVAEVTALVLRARADGEPVAPAIRIAIDTQSAR